MKIALFSNYSVIGNRVLNNLVPQMIELGFEPVLFRNKTKLTVRSSAMDEVDLQEAGLLEHVVEPTLAGYIDSEVHLTDKNLAERYNLEYHEIENVNDPTFVEMIQQDPDWVGGLSTRFYTIFQSEIINIFKERGFLWNLHPGILPDYKGRYIPYWAIDNNENFCGWSLHEVDEGIDTGNILGVDRNAFDRTKPILNTYFDMTDKMVTMIMGALMFYAKHKRPPPSVAQNTSHGRYYGLPEKVDMKRWNDQGIRFADDIVQTYLNLYTTPNTQERRMLKERLETAILEFDAEKPQGITITTYQSAA